MKILAGILFLAGVLLMPGCAGDRHSKTTDLENVNLREIRPPFLAGPVSILFTNTGSFSAKVVLETTSSNRTHQLMGQLLARDNRFIFSPSGKQKRRGMDMTFTWDGNVGTGYIFNDALQGYAPLTAHARPISITPMADAVPADGPVSGHPCHISTVAIGLEDGSKAQYKVWKADDLHGFPLRILSLGGHIQTSIDLSDIRAEEPPLDLFLPPDGFTKYSSQEAMIDELLHREMPTVKGRPHMGEPDFTNPGYSPSGQRMNRY